MVSLRWQPLHTITSSLVEVVSKPLMGLTNLNQALICTPSLVMNRLDPIEELYDMYLEEKDTLRIIEIENNRLDLDLDVEGPADPYMDL